MTEVYALKTIQRSGRRVVPAGSVFDATDEELRDLDSKNAVRPATREEIAVKRYDSAESAVEDERRAEALRKKYAAADEGAAGAHKAEAPVKPSEPAKEEPAKGAVKAEKVAKQAKVETPVIKAAGEDLGI